jgi:hypothetical protein
MSIETRIRRLVKKTGVKKSRWTVPLKEDNFVTTRLDLQNVTANVWVPLLHIGRSLFEFQAILKSLTVQ